MNKLFIIENCVRDPELRTTTSGKNVCSFTVAVNNRKRKEGDQDHADFFRVSAWDQLGENCAKYLAKGKKVSVVGSVGIHVYSAQDGSARANMEVLANEVEFLSSRQDQEAETQQETQQKDEQSGFAKVETDELPF